MAAALILAACGGDDDDASDDDAPAEDLMPIKVGLIYNSVNVQGAGTPSEFALMAQAWVKDVNDKGGIEGHPVELILKDYGTDITKSAQLIRELDAEGAHVITQSQAGVLPVVNDLVKASSDLFILCGQPYQTLFETEPRFFHCGSTLGTGVFGQMGTAKVLGAKHFFTVYCAEVAGCAQSVPVLTAAGTELGIKTTFQAASNQAADYTPTCIAAKQAGADYLQVNGVLLANVVRDCKAQNYTPTFGLVATGQATLDALAGAKGAGNLWDFPAFYEGPETREFVRLAARYRNDIPTPGVPGTQSFLTFEMFRVLTELVVADNDKPTRADFLKATAQIKNETLGGLIAPVTYGPVDKPKPKGNCWFSFLAEGGKYFSLDGTGQKATKLTPVCKS